MANQGIFSGGVKIRSLNGYLIAVNGEVFATTNTGGTTNAFFYKAKTTITSGDPTNGHLIWNNATQISATQLNVSHLTDTPVEDIDLFLSAITSGNKLVVQDRDNSLNYQSWTVSGTPTQVGSTYWTIPVTFLESSGTGTTGFANNHNLLFAIITGGAGGGGITTNAVTFNNSGSGAASGTSFNGATAVTVSYNTFGAQQASASLTSLAGLTYASTSFVKMTAAGTFALDTNTYLTANQTITLSGNVTGSGTTTITTTIANNVVTNAMLAQIATASIKGRVTGGTGNVEDLTGTQVTTLLDNFTSALKGLAPASGGGTTNFLRADGTWAAPPGGTTTNALTINNSGSGAASGTTFNGSSAVTISHNTIGAQALNSNLTSLSGLTFASTSFVKMTGANTFALDTNTYLTANQSITLSGDVTGTGTTTITATIANNVVTLAKFQQIATASFLGRVTAATGNAEVLTGTQATTLLDTFTSALKGLAPASGGGTSNFLRADGTWATPAGGGGTTTNAVTFNNSGSGAASGTTFDGSVARTISYNTIGANKVITSGTSTPTGGIDGDIYLQYDVSLLTGSGTTNYVPKFTSSTAIGNSQIFDDGTNVGIGTTSPAVKLDIHGTNVIAQFNGTTTNNAYLDFQNAGSTQWRIGNQYAAAVNRFSIFNAAGTTEVFTIIQGGNVGINRTSPNYSLDVNGTGFFTSLITSGASSPPIKLISSVNGTYGGANFAQFFRADGSTARAYIGYGQGNDQNFQIATQESGGILQFKSGAEILALTLGSDQSAQFAGNVGIGYTAPAAKLAVSGTTLINTNTDNGVDKLQVSGSIISSSTVKCGANGVNGLIVNSGGATGAILNNTATSGGAGFDQIRLTFQHLGADRAYWYYSNSGNALVTSTARTADDITFAPGNSNALYMKGSTGNVVISNSGTDNGVDKLQVSGSTISTQYKLSALNTAPATASSSGTLGEIRIDATAIYICTATNTWKRALITTF